MINSIFKHSQGFVLTRWNNNEGNYHFTDIFGTPEDNKHILSPDHGCSDKSAFNLALAYRNRPQSANNGYCFKAGKPNTDSNCVCKDTHGGNQLFGRCTGGYNNWRRYNGRRNQDRFCTGMHRKCASGIQYGPLGDSYNCNIGGMRTVTGHMWQSHPGYNGMPCQCNYFSGSCYGCYGSRWIG